MTEILLPSWRSGDAGKGGWSGSSAIVVKTAKCWRMEGK
jgi:hypothetical protein